MKTLMVDSDGCMMGIQLPPPPDFKPPTIAESLARGFESGAEFIVVAGKPVVVWPKWDYAEYWSRYPIREIHPFIPILDGQEIEVTDFRDRVKALHGLA